MIVTVNGKNHTVSQIDIDKVVTKLSCSEDEAIEMILTDRGILVNDEQTALNAEAKQVKWTKVEAKSGKRERKPNEEKIQLVKDLAEALIAMNVENVAIVKPEREVSFLLGNNSYSVTLTLHRPPKEKEGK